jgi:hypothetical protein
MLDNSKQNTGPLFNLVRPLLWPGICYDLPTRLLFGTPIDFLQLLSIYHVIYSSLAVVIGGKCLLN